MATEKQPTVIKKYANRRLYHTGTSAYVTLDDLGTMVKAGDDFVVYDAKTGEDITRPVLTQIIFEQENKVGAQNLLPVTFLRQLIRFYGDSMQAMVPSYLEFSMDHLTREQEKIRQQMTEAFGGKAFIALDEQVRANMSFFSETMRMFAPFAPRHGSPDGEKGDAAVEGAEKSEGKGDPQGDAEIDKLKAQMQDMQAKLSQLAKKE
jgi:polyhydroxyalkanoate synthesis repressor PhaR